MSVYPHHLQDGVPERVLYLHRSGVRVGPATVEVIGAIERYSFAGRPFGASVTVTTPYLSPSGGPGSNGAILASEMFDSLAEAASWLWKFEHIRIAESALATVDEAAHRASALSGAPGQ